MAVSKMLWSCCCTVESVGVVVVVVDDPSELTRVDEVVTAPAADATALNVVAVRIAATTLTLDSTEPSPMALRAW
jgi:hypothetical protein